ncbi:MAG: GNAT family N-acetyltransferase [Chloroflexota bacterium]|nr:MAG: GNAT family N-acetyltransferase [Chloroflexota bacterium]
MMEILEYNDVDPLKVMYLTQLALDFALTPEMVARIRQSDPRPFPFLAIYAVENDIVLGQVGVFRLPMISTEGREDVGGIWAVSTHPEYAGRGVASRLLEEAHTRMRETGLRFSTLGTNRYRVAYNLYRQHGYQETNVWAIALAPWETVHQPTRLRAQPLGTDGYDFVDKIYMDIAQDYLGFAWRYIPFARLRRVVNSSDIWILRENNRVIGYALTSSDQTMLTISNLVLQRNIDIAEATAAVAAELKSEYVQVKLSRPSEITSLRNAGYRVTHPTWDAFMVKPLVPEVTFEDAQERFGIGTDRFLISWLDTT